MDAFTQFLTPLYHSVAFNPDGLEIPANWIWHEEREFDRVVLPHPGQRFFRKKFTIGDVTAVKKAEAIVTADHRYHLYLNGNLLGMGDEWHVVDHYLFDQHLRSENIIGIVGENLGAVPNPAGLLFLLTITYEDETVDTIYSNDSWLTYDQKPEDGWIAIDFDDQDWSPARKYGSFDKSYWGQLLDFNFQRNKKGIARAALVQLDPFMKVLGRPVRENVTTSRPYEATPLAGIDAFQQ